MRHVRDRIENHRSSGGIGTSLAAEDTDASLRRQPRRVPCGIAMDEDVETWIVR